VKLDYGKLDVADALLSHAADSDVDFIVIGRLRPLAPA
jgi:hypothetical protein